MELIEQAVFTSAVTNRAAGYQVVGMSPGVREDDARELAVWCPSHDALLDGSPVGQSVNFHPLPSGSFCVSRTVAAGWEYSGRGGARVYTQALLVPPAVLARFSNNPFALLKAALAAGFLRQYDEVPEQLAAFRLSGRATAVDPQVLSELGTQLGPTWLATLLQAALSCHTLVTVGGTPADHLFSGLLACLPLACRTEFTFSTGLRFSSRRPFRLVALSPDKEELRRIQRLYNVVVLDLTGAPPAEYAAHDSWARLVERMFRHGKGQQLALELSQRHQDVTLEDLPALGLQLLEEWDDAFHVRTANDAEFDASPSGDTPSHPAPAPVTPLSTQEELSDRKLPERLQQAHAAHNRFEKTASTPVVKVAPPSEHLAAGDATLREQLQVLDTAVYDAVTGRDEALEQIKVFWPEWKAAKPRQLVAQSREEYLRYALAIWEASLGSEGLRDPQRAILSLDVLCVLFDDVP